MNISYWEHEHWLKDIDHAVIGSGIVGLNCAYQLKKKFPQKKVVVFEKGVLPSGASTKNAGFACFGSVSEILDDLQHHSEDEVIELVNKRISGLNLLRETLGDEALRFERFGGYEVFPLDDNQLYDSCIEKIDYVNGLMNETILRQNDVFSIKNNAFGFKNVQNQLIFNQFEGQINTGRMMAGLIDVVQKLGVLVLNSTKIDSFSRENGKIHLVLDNFGEISVESLFIATNGFARQLLSEDVSPARAQVLVTSPIADLKIKGTFHLDKGYYYFRNVDNRILFGGGRNLDFKAEETENFGLTPLVQDSLEEILRTTILPDTPFKIDRRWSGIMGVGPKKKPIVRKLDEGIYCGIRLGGMGVAIGSSVGAELADLVDT